MAASVSGCQPRALSQCKPNGLICSNARNTGKAHHTRLSAGKVLQVAGVGERVKVDGGLVRAGLAVENEILPMEPAAPVTKIVIRYQKIIARRSRAPINILKTDDIVLSQIFTALDFNHDQVHHTGIIQPVLVAGRDVG
jgi:hypothetical protein